MTLDEEPAIVRVDHASQPGAVSLRINRPKVRNALRFEDLRLLNELLLDCQHDPAVKVVMLTGSEGAFCAGADLKAVNAAAGSRDFSGAELASEVLNRIMSMSKIVIAAVNGPAAGLGHHLSVVCDLTIVRSDASFHFTGPAKGIPSLQLGALVLPMMIGLKRAKELLLRGGVVSAERAVELGFANAVVTPMDWDAYLADLLAEFAGRNASVMALDKYQVNQLAYQMTGPLKLSGLAGAARMATMGQVVTGRLQQESVR
jgi:enoyl-CoA hydratase/carnithine racemase